MSTVLTGSHSLIKKAVPTNWFCFSNFSRVNIHLQSLPKKMKSRKLWIIAKSFKQLEASNLAHTKLSSKPLIALSLWSLCSFFLLWLSVSIVVQTIFCQNGTNYENVLKKCAWKCSKFEIIGAFNFCLKFPGSIGKRTISSQTPLNIVRFRVI